MTARDLDPDTIIRLIGQGVARTKIARDFGISLSSLSHWCSVRGITPCQGGIPWG